MSITKNKHLIIVFAVIVVVIFIFFLYFGSGIMMNSGMNGRMNENGWMSGNGWVWFFTLFTFGLIVLIGWLIFRKKN